jgi:hypothetical protein
MLSRLSCPDRAPESVGEGLGLVWHGASLAASDPSSRPCGHRSIEDVVNAGRTARDSEIAGECDPSMGEQVTAPFGTRPGGLTQGQRCAGQLGKADLRMNLDDAVASFADPALKLEQFGLEAESLDRDPPRPRAPD